MRVLHVAKKYPDMLGGDAVYIDALVRRSRARGDEAFVAAPDARELIRSPTVRTFGPRIPTERLDLLGSHRLRLLRDLRKAMPGLLAWSSPDAIHAHSADFGYAISRIPHMGTPVVLTCHSLSFPTLPWWSAKAVLERRCLRRGRFRAVTVLYPRAVRFLDGLVSSPVIWIPGGVDTEAFAPGPKTESDAVRLLFVGRLEREKGPDVLLEALGRTHTRVRASFVGEGGMRASLQSRALGLNGVDRARFEGAVSNRSALAERYRQSDVFVLPSRLEGGVPLALLEAWASGLPAIATGVEPIADLEATDAALTVPPGDVDALARAIDTLAADATLRRRMGERGRALVLARFSWESVAERFFTLYDSLR
ncbi:MAG TPA: glycosyltransferase family 4 protein [Thermoplasmata archaeon]|nr:glycosyltransferase family 4 protein [Thermoplasmata archaeon]